jgi:hypothetical protein
MRPVIRFCASVQYQRGDAVQIFSPEEFDRNSPRSKCTPAGKSAMHCATETLIPDGETGLGSRPAAGGAHRTRHPEPDRPPYLAAGRRIFATAPY